MHLVLSMGVVVFLSASTCSPLFLKSFPISYGSEIHSAVFHSENGIEKTSVVKIWKLVRNGFEHKNRFKKHTPMSNGPQKINFNDAL